MSRQPIKSPAGGVAPFPKARFEAFLKELRVQTKDLGLEKLWDNILGTQKYALDEIVSGIDAGITTFVIVKARQLGMSTFLLALDLFWGFEYPGLCGAVGTHDDLNREQFRQMVNVYFAHLPKTHKIKVRTHNRSMLVLQNGSQFSYLVAGVKTKSRAGLGRGGAYNFLHATEVAYWGTEDDLKELRAAMSTHYPHRLQIFESTANGFNHFQEMVEKAEQSPTQKVIFVGWWRNELYAYADDHPFFTAYMPQGRDTVLTVLERKRSRVVKELYGFDIGPEQIAWYRWKLEDECDGDQMKMDEMFPWTIEDAFVATGAKFFTNESLTDAMRTARKTALKPFRYVLGQRWSDTGVLPLTKAGHADLKVYEEPHPDGFYTIGCDPAYGSSETADRTAMEVFRCFADRCVQVAEFTSPSVSTYQCAWVLAHLAGWFRNVMVNLEISGPGQAVFGELNALRQATAAIPVDRGDIEGSTNVRQCLVAMRHYLHRRVDSMSQEFAYQWRTTAENKLAIMNSLKDSFELSRCMLVSMQLLDEMKGMVYDDGSVYAEGRKKDDRVMAAALGHEAWKKWLQPRLIGQGLTYASSLKEQTGAPRQVQHMVADYLRRARIKVG